MPQAIPGRSQSALPVGSVSRAGPGGSYPYGQGLLRVVSSDELTRQRTSAAAGTANKLTKPVPDIGSYIRRQWTIFRDHRNQGTNPLSQRLLRAQRMFEGKYDPEHLHAIKQFGGSEVYSRLVAVKCRGASSLLRDVYLGADRPWDIQAQPDPPVPAEIRQSATQLVATEVANQKMMGQPVLPEQAKSRLDGLLHAAQQAAAENANEQANRASDAIEDLLVEGRFYDAMAQFLVDLPLFPWACIKGPVVRMVPKLSWTANPDGTKTASIERKAQMFWERVSPFDLYWTPGVSNIADASTLERHRFTRTDINDLIGLPGYDDDALAAVLDDYDHGLREWLDATDAEQALNENREDPNLNRSEMIEGLEFHGNVQGRVLIDSGMNPKLIKDPLRDYNVQSWVIGRHTIKTIINPMPRQRHPYYLTSFEKSPGTVVGHGLPDLLEDLQEVCNATLRALVNNMSIASGPQVVVNDDALSPAEDGNQLYPWKRWHVQGDLFTNQREPITFFQPNSNAQELLSVYTAISALADEISAIPKYITGSSQGLGGAGRTASGLSMLMGNAEKVLQTVAANVDGDIMDPLLSQTYDLIMMTDQTGMLTGDEEIRVRGVNVAVQKETERQKQLQFLQITANPIDAPIVGEIGRARVLRSVAQSLGLPDDVVPSDQELQAKQDAQKQMQAAGQSMVAASGGQPGQPGQPGSSPGQPPGGQAQAGGPPGAAQGAAQQAQGAQAPAAPPASHADHAPPVNLMQQGIPHA